MAGVELPDTDHVSHSGIFGYATDALAVAVAIKALVIHENVFPAVAADQPPPIPATQGT